uniref:Uncharacterized protein n=1 Tax=Anguilla anguilla TaxID=7936 RepID=A0A0E9S4U4_ANGAN
MNEMRLRERFSALSIFQLNIHHC